MPVTIDMRRAGVAAPLPSFVFSRDKSTLMSGVGWPQSSRSRRQVQPVVLSFRWLNSFYTWGWFGA